MWRIVLISLGVSEILGCEVSGVITAVGPSCQNGLCIGDIVMALLPGGGYAEYCTCDERTVCKVPEGVDLRTAAAIPEAFITAYQLLFTVAQLQPGETVLMHAAASSIGQAAIQLATLNGIRVVATSRTDGKCATCIELGASVAIKVGDDGRFLDQVLAATNGVGVNAVLDPVCGSYFADNIAVTALDGRIVVYGLMGGGNVSDATFLNKLLAKRIRLLPTTLRTRSLDYKAAIIASLATNAVGFASVVKGDIKVDVFTTFPLEQVVDAHALMTANGNTGKILLVASND